MVAFTFDWKVSMLQLIQTVRNLSINYLSSRLKSIKVVEHRKHIEWENNEDSSSVCQKICCVQFLHNYR